MRASGPLYYLKPYSNFFKLTIRIIQYKTIFIHKNIIIISYLKENVKVNPQNSIICKKYKKRIIN